MIARFVLTGCSRSPTTCVAALPLIVCSFVINRHEALETGHFGVRWLDTAFLAAPPADQGHSHQRWVAEPDHRGALGNCLHAPLHSRSRVDCQESEESGVKPPHSKAAA